jgi:hypothetical protein
MMQGLPHMDMFLQLEVSLLERKTRIEDKDKPKVVVRVELADEAGKSLMKDISHLNQWAWYGPAEPYKASSGFRDSFKPSTKVKYLLTIEVMEPDPKARNLYVEAIVHNSCSL